MAVCFSRVFVEFHNVWFRGPASQPADLRVLCADSQFCGDTGGGNLEAEPAGQCVPRLEPWNETKDHVLRNGNVAV